MHHFSFLSPYPSLTLLC